MRLFQVLVLLLVFGASSNAGAQALSYPAENQVPVTLIEVTRLPQYTEVKLRADADLDKVCWADRGGDSPYLVAEGQRYRFVEGLNISICSDRRGYRRGEVMVLRFEPLPPAVHQMSLVEGQGGENQMADPVAQRGMRYWNFLRIALP